MERNDRELTKLEAGKFYIDRDGFVWCCYRINMLREVHTRAECVRLYDARLESFYLDGRYDAKGAREHTLMRELPELLRRKDDGSTRTVA